MLVEYGQVSENSFPELISPEKLTKDTGNRDAGFLFIEMKHKLIECGYSYPAFSTIVAEGNVACISIGRLELFRFATPQMIKMVFEQHTDACYQDYANIMQDYKEKMAWDGINTSQQHRLQEESCTRNTQRYLEPKRKKVSRNFWRAMDEIRTIATHLPDEEDKDKEVRMLNEIPRVHIFVYQPSFCH